jgi:hypothetical protein
MKKAVAAVVFLAGVMGWALLAGGAPGDGSAATVPDAAAELAMRLAAIRGVRTLETQFVCQKRVVNLETPLLGGGRMWMEAAEADDAGSGGMRIATEWPYVSELILTRGKAMARSQHETEWSTTAQSERPGLTATMVQLGHWSLGERGREDLFAVSRGGEAIPARPGVSSGRGSAAPQADAMPGVLFVLAPVNKELQISVKRVTLGFRAPATDPSDHAVRADRTDPTVALLIYAEIVTAQDDVSRYWFFDAHLNRESDHDMLKPESPRDAAKP